MVVRVADGDGFQTDFPSSLKALYGDLSNSYVMNYNIVNDSATWSARLGHIGQDKMTRLARECLLGPLAKVNLQTCEPCLAGKACMKPLRKAVKATQPLELVYSNLTSIKF
ncbi:hypothetical protein RJ640_003812 [Escallonia rubra]|uniref:GAG-pre-integrase domain-containing protein n=1 Tax=Escallonia rubra TaxID=112253 RepID=A0AA88RRR0_9ASTE|nr:hypothetical protein RJ640_003812 [Escallonia rubra]